MNIVNELKSLVLAIIKNILQLTAFSIAATLLPLAMIILPLLFVLGDPATPHDDLAEFFLVAGPFSCGFFMLLSCHYHSVRQWQRMGMLHQWREDHGGYFHTIGKSTLFLFGGIITSALFEALFCGMLYAANHIVPMGYVVGQIVWFSMFPLFCYAPMILLWITRRNYDEFSCDALLLGKR